MDFGSPFSGLFAHSGADPRSYVGAAQTRRPPSPAVVRSSGRPGSPASGTDGRGSPSPQSTQGQRSIETFDMSLTVAPKNGAILDSPRSLSACRKLGILPEELLRPTLEACRDKMAADGEPITDETVVQLRFNYLCRRQRQKIEAVTQERERLIVSDIADGGHSASGASSPGAGRENVSTMILEDERRLKRVIAANLSRAKQQLLHHELRSKQRSKEDARLREQQQRDEQMELQRRALERKKEQCEEEAQRLRIEAKNLEREEAKQFADERRAAYEDKDKEIQERILTRQMLLQEKNEQKRQHNAARRDQMRAEARRLLEEKRSKYEARWKEFDEAQRQLEIARKEHEAQLAIEAQAKQEEIEEAKIRSAKLLEAKIRRTLAREQQSHLMMRERQQLRDQELAEKALQDEEREAKRAQVYNEARKRDQGRVSKLLTKIRQIDEHVAQQHELNEAHARVRAELARQKQLDKKECVLRARRAEEASKEDLMESIESKRQRVETMKRQQEELKRRRQELRVEVERTRVHMTDPSPGPQDYVALNETIGRTGSKWKFGLPASMLAARQISKNQPAAGYVTGPGPERYSPVKRSGTPAFSIGRSSRWGGDGGDAANSSLHSRPASAPLM